MNVVQALGTKAQSAESSFTAPSNELGKQEFLKILMTQLKNQDPLSPMDDREFIGQMAQLSTLEATNNLGNQIGAMIAIQQQTQALEMVGRQIEYVDVNGQVQQGKVTGARLDGQPPLLVLGEKQVPVTWVRGVV